MKQTSSDQPPYLDRIRSWARTHAYGGTKRSTSSGSNPTLPLSNPRSPSQQLQSVDSQQHDNTAAPNGDQGLASQFANGSTLVRSDSDTANKSTASASKAEESGHVVNSEDSEEKKPNIINQFYLTTKKILFHSWINLGLVFVPVGIVVANIPNANSGAIFGINAIAIIPLAALLSYATESVARKMGDTIGALLNVTFGNAVELIIFIALVKGEIRVVQASLLGSILANLLLILGGAFFLGGLRFREQVYNSTVTQMSACLLSLSVISLVLPTAFHASFKDSALADEQSLKISRGTSVILLLIYVVYLLFQLKSHAYMYESTPQHIIDEESTPGPAAAWLDTSSSDSSSSSDSDSDSSAQSRNTMSRRVKRAIRARRHRKSSVASIDTDEERVRTRTSSFNFLGPCKAKWRMVNLGVLILRITSSLLMVQPNLQLVVSGDPLTICVGYHFDQLLKAWPRQFSFSRHKLGLPPLNLFRSAQFLASGAMFPAQLPPSVLANDASEAAEVHEDDLSRPAAIILLLITTALVATCAEFLVDSIEDVVASSSLKEIFIGLIILPIVGNAAEHVTAVTVAMKNKMDLAIGVAIGSSIQIALFVTPFVVILGWIINQPMTLYFTLFETVSLFVSAFIINFLILDGRSNYLEGALLVATYVIIGIIAFFYPEGTEANEWSA
ncbi:hypothetical protein ONZ43_g6315 [Nemania bipapillata]|uniref:Uncharacterized protein n=1 Tax=Nemania bipapillata TaxID=110536 RepID=A0ACC2I1F7_9PEZI|nr:hypothetical protein ONZ43_g6315 [Nemania bipapillata]